MPGRFSRLLEKPISRREKDRGTGAANTAPERFSAATAEKSHGAGRRTIRRIGVPACTAALVVAPLLLSAASVQAGESAPRILSLAPGLTEIAFAAGAGELLVGTVEFSDYPEAAKRVPRVGDAWRVDLEHVLALRPDVVLAWPTGTPATTVARLRKLGLKVVEVPTQRLADVPVALRRVGRISGTASRAEAAAREFETRVAQQRATYARRTPLSVFIEIDDEPVYTVNGRHVISEIVELCGGRNVFADLPQLAPPIAIEAVLAADPQVILSTDDTIADPRALWQRWPRLRALQAGTVYSLSSDLVTRASPRLAEGVEVTCQTLERARGEYLRRGNAPSD